MFTILALSTFVTVAPLCAVKLAEYLINKYI